MGRWAILAVATLLMLPGLGQAGELQRIRERGEIRVSLNRGYPPFAMETSGAFHGLDVDLAHLLADYLGVEARFVQPETYEEQIPKLLAGESDIIMAAMTRTMERGLQVHFSTPYFEVSQAALARRDKVSAGADAYFDLLEVKGLRLGVKTGTTHEAFARQLFPEEAIRGYPTAEAAAEAVVRGEVDAMAADSPFVQVWRNTHVDQYYKVTALLAPVTREFYAFAVRQGDPDFLQWVNLFVDQIRTDGTLELLRHEYFEKLAWATGASRTIDPAERVRFLKDRFSAERRALMEARREAFLQNGDPYE
jgi:polar amino acid transport system substrate-binding protein